MSVVSAQRRRSAAKHADRIRKCLCGKECRGNGGWSSHRKVCEAVKAYRATKNPADRKAHP